MLKAADESNKYAIGVDSEPERAPPGLRAGLDGEEHRRLARGRCQRLRSRASSSSAQTTDYGLANNGVGSTSRTTTTSSRRRSRTRSRRTPQKVIDGQIKVPTRSDLNPAAAGPARRTGSEPSLPVRTFRRTDDRREDAPWPHPCSSSGTSPRPSAPRSPNDRHLADASCPGGPRPRRRERRGQDDAHDDDRRDREPDSGTIQFDGRVVEITSPQKASALGIGMVHQHFKLVPSLTSPPTCSSGASSRTARGTIDTATMEQRSPSSASSSGWRSTPTRGLVDSSVGQRQRVEVLKALSHDTRLLILDEPTAVLTPREIDELVHRRPRPAPRKAAPSSSSRTSSTRSWRSPTSSP